MIKCLKLIYPKSLITYVTEEKNKDILKGSLCVDRVIGISTADRKSLLKFLALANRLRIQHKVDIFVNLQPSLKSICFGLALIPKSVWNFKKDRRIQLSTGRVRHAIDDFINTIPKKVRLATFDRNMDFQVSQEDHMSVISKLRGIGVTTERLVVINPAGTRDINRWPPLKFAELIRWLVQHPQSMQVVLIGAASDHTLEKEVIENTGFNVPSLVGSLHLGELAGLLRAATVVLTGDTGPLHLAEAVGAKIVCLSGAADPNRTGPSNNWRDIVVIQSDLSCVPCQGRTCKRGDIACMNEMDVSRVADAISRRMRSL